jgi:hypothetical protein
MKPARAWTIVAASAVAGLACVTSEVTPIGRSYPAFPAGCPVAVFPSTKPNVAYEDVASVQARCHYTQGRTACINELRAKACESGADIVYAFNEGMMNGYTIISATFARQSKESPVATKPTGATSVPEATKPAASTAPAAPTGDCSPPCSPGFACNGSVCQPLCNPPCEKGETCTRKRICEPTPSAI